MDDHPSHATQAAADSQADGLASALLGGFSLVAAAVGLVFNIVLASVGHSIMRPFEVRLHFVGTLVVLLLMLWLCAQGLRLGVRGSGGLAVAGRSLSLAALVLWLLFALGEVFVIGGMW